MIYVFIFTTVVAVSWGFYLLTTLKIEDSNNKILDKLKWIEKQNNLLREEVNELRLQVNDIQKSVKKIEV